MKTVVLGIGNTLLTDEGVGVHVLQDLQARRGSADDDIAFVDGGTLSFTLAVPIESADALIVVDAAALGAAPGTVRLFVNAEMDHFLGHGGNHGVHEVGLLDLLSIAALSGRLPQRRALVGIQPEKIEWGTAPTPAVAAAIPRACALIDELIDSWQAGEDLCAVAPSPQAVAPPA